MKLTDLAPKWSVDPDILVGMTVVHDPARHGMGITFACPHCVVLHPNEPLERGGLIQFIGVFFMNPLDGKPHTDNVPTHKLWARIGDSFENLSLHPSIDASSSGHFHGYITDGKIT